MVRPFG